MAGETFGLTAGQAAQSPEIVRDVLLSDGSTLRLRAPGPDDFDDVVAFYDGLSPESLYMRFHGFGRTDIAARGLIQSSGVDRAALIGRHGGKVVAIGQYELLREPGAAEVAFAVGDDFRRRGMATRMLEQLAAIASERGISRFDASVLSSNRAMLRVFAKAGFDIRRRGAYGELTVSLDITPSEEVRERIDERDHLAAVASLRAVLSPASVAVIGASEGLGELVLGSIVHGGFRGEVMAVGSGSSVHGVDCARSLSELEAPPELAILAVEPEAVAAAAADAAAAGAKALLVLSSLPDRGGSQGAAQRQELLEVVRAGGMRLLGPGSLGVINTDRDVSLRATSSAAPVAAGRLAIGSQSGAIGIGLLGLAAARGLGVCSYASLGERVDISTNDLLELWEDDKRAHAVMLYMETFGNPEHFTRIAQRVSRRKPILVVKGRRLAEAARREGETHTAAALTGDAVVDALFHQAGMLRFRSGEDLFNAAQFFQSQPLPLGRRVAVVSNSGGLATLAVDACVTRGLVISEEESATANPLVLSDDDGPGRYSDAVGDALGDAGVDALMIYYADRAGGDPDQVMAAVTTAWSRGSKPVVASVVRADGTLADSPDGLIPNFLFPEACAGVLARAVRRREWLSRPLGERASFGDVDVEAARAQVTSCLEREERWLTLAEGEALLATHAIEFEPAAVCLAVEDAVGAAGEIGAPVALKAARPAPETGADLDAVLLGLEGEDAIRSGWRELQLRTERCGRTWQGAIVQRLVESGADLLVGAMSDPDLGRVMAVGLGGRQAGLTRGAVFRLLPETDVEADELIDASRGVVALLDGFRGGMRLYRQGMRDLLLRFAALLRECPEVVETDLNPVRLTPGACVVLEMRMRLERRRPAQRIKTW